MHRMCEAHDIMMKNRLLARDDFSNALSELCSRYYIMKKCAERYFPAHFSYQILNIILLLIFKECSLF